MTHLECNPQMFGNISHQGGLQLHQSEGSILKIRPNNSVTYGFEELSGPEKQWLEQAIRRVIYRLGERASGVPLTRIRMSDLPKL